MNKELKEMPVLLKKNLTNFLEKVDSVIEKHTKEQIYLADQQKLIFKENETILNDMKKNLILLNGMVQIKKQSLEIRFNNPSIDFTREVDYLDSIHFKLMQLIKEYITK